MDPDMLARGVQEDVNQRNCQFSSPGGWGDEGLNDWSCHPVPVPPHWGSPVPPTHSQFSLLQPHPRAATSPYPLPTGPTILEALLRPSLPTCPSGGDWGSLSPASSSSSPPCLWGRQASPANRASFMAVGSPGHVKCG